MKPELTTEQFIKADLWRHKHKLHVHTIIKNIKHGYKPSLEDINHPELWKPEHWRWFDELLKTKP